MKLRSGCLLCNTNQTSPVLRGCSEFSTGTPRVAQNSAGPRGGTQVSQSKPSSKKKANSSSQIHVKHSDLGQDGIIHEASIESVPPLLNFIKRTVLSEEETGSHDDSPEKVGRNSQVDSHSPGDRPSFRPACQFDHAVIGCVGSGHASVAESGEVLQKRIFEGSWSSISSISPTGQDSFPGTDWPCNASIEGSVIGDYLPQLSVARNGSIASSKSTKRHSWHCKGRKAMCKLSFAMVDYVFAP